MNLFKTYKRAVSLIAISLLWLNGFSQSSVPEGILFQALAKDPSGVAAKGRIIHIKDAIIQSTPTGNSVWIETFVVTASDEGIFTITIGQGTKTTGPSKLSGIDWGAGPYFLNIQAAIEPSVPTPEWKVDEQYVDMGTSQFWTVPFAFKAASVAGIELLLKAADTTAMLAPYLRKSDTAMMLNNYLHKGDTSFNNLIYGKVNIADTLSMLNAYQRKLDTALMLKYYLRKGDTSLNNLINGKVNIADTLNMLNAYQRKLDTALMLKSYLHKGDTSLNNLVTGKLNISDTLSMLNAYQRKLDTALMLNSYLHKGDTSFTNLVTVKLNISDTINMLNAYQRKIDTAAMLSSYIRRTDTSAMLNPYLRKGDTALSGMINSKINISDTINMLNSYQRKIDTAAMLSPYLRKTDTLSLSTRIATKLSIADTTTMLNPYYKTANAITDLAARELLANKSANTSLGTSDTLYPTQKAVKVYIDSAITANGGATPDATLIQKGKIQLAGDLAGTAAAPVIGDGKISTVKIADSAVTLAKLQAIGSGKLLGNPSGSTATASEITLGTGLSFTGNTLNATAAAALDTFATNLVVYAANGLGKYSQGQTIPAIGKTAKQVLMDVIMQTIAPTYTQPTVGISANPSAGTYEIGSALNITLTASFNQNDAGAQTSSSFSKNGSGLGGNTDNIASLIAAVSYTATVNYAAGATKNNNVGTPDPTGQISAGSKTSAAITFTPQAKRYWGYSSNTTPTDADIKTALGGGSELSSAKAKTSFDITISGGSNYIFFAYPASLGALSNLTVGGFGSLPSFTLITRSFTNASGYAQSYNIYINPNAFSTPVSNITTN
jgi:hypothetical protein